MAGHGEQRRRQHMFFKPSPDWEDCVQTSDLHKEIDISVYCLCGTYAHVRALSVVLFWPW